MVIVNEESASLGSIRAAIDSANGGDIYVEEGNYPAQALPLPAIVGVIGAVVILYTELLKEKNLI